MNIYQLKAFIQVVETGSLYMTAEMLNTSYQTVARHINALEDEFHAKFFTRNKKGCLTTSEGELFYNYAKTVLNDYSKMMDSFTQNSSFVLGMDSVIVPKYLGAIISQLGENYNISLKNYVYLSLFEHVINKDIDCFFGHDRDYGKTIRFKKLDDDCYVVAMLPNNPLYTKEFISASDFANTTVHIDISYTPAARQIAESIQKNSPNCTLTSNHSYTSVVSGVLSGNLLSIIPKSYSQHMLDGLVFKPFENIHLNYGLYYLEGNSIINEIIEIYEHTKTISFQR